MKRRSSLPPRTTPLARKPRKPSETLRIYGPPERRKWITRQPCIVRSRICDGPIQNVHTEGGGTSRKADADTIVPMCRWHHNQLHHVGAESFQRGHAVDLKAAAARTESLWQSAGALAGTRSA